MSYRPAGACDPRMLLELGVIGSLSAAQLLDIWDRFLSYEEALVELTNGTPAPSPEQVADRRLAVAELLTNAVQ
jgi:hypothetical protein